MARRATWASRASSASSTGWLTIDVAVSVAPTDPSTNFEALSTFIASRRPTFIWVSSNGESSPGRVIAARQRTASAPNFARISSGTIALPLDLAIFLRSGSTMNPEIIAVDHGATWFSKWARTTRENSQVRMISWAWVHRSIGKTRCQRSSSVSQPPAMCGVSDEVAQVSITSGSPTKPPGLPRCSSSYPAGAAVDGSSGSWSSVGVSGWS